jgi:hypothetical protein
MRTTITKNKRLRARGLCGIVVGFLNINADVTMPQIEKQCVDGELEYEFMGKLEDRRNIGSYHE